MSTSWLTDHIAPNLSQEIFLESKKRDGETFRVGDRGRDEREREFCDVLIRLSLAGEGCSSRSVAKTPAPATAAPPPATAAGAVQWSACAEWSFS